MVVRLSGPVEAVDGAAAELSSRLAELEATD
jgi:hypothetical protein